jgi:hypothetical protein
MRDCGGLAPQESESQMAGMFGAQFPLAFCLAHASDGFVLPPMR